MCDATDRFLLPCAGANRQALFGLQTGLMATSLALFVVGMIAAVPEKEVLEKLSWAKASFEPASGYQIGLYLGLGNYCQIISVPAFGLDEARCKYFDADDYDSASSADHEFFDAARASLALCLIKLILTLVLLVFKASSSRANPTTDGSPKKCRNLILLALALVLGLANIGVFADVPSALASAGLHARSVLESLTARTHAARCGGASVPAVQTRSTGASTNPEV